MTSLGELKKLTGCLVCDLTCIGKTLRQWDFKKDESKITSCVIGSAYTDTANEADAKSSTVEIVTADPCTKIDCIEKDA